MSTNKRRFVPMREFCGNSTVRTRITHYIWTRGQGLRVYFNTGMDWKSAYTLPELLASFEVRETTLDGERL